MWGESRVAAPGAGPRKPDDAVKLEMWQWRTLMRSKGSRSTAGAAIWWRLEVDGIPLDRLMYTPGSVTGQMVRAGVRELLARYGITVGDRVG